MREKRPVYNGYDEFYLSGAELKQRFSGYYYTTSRHHSVTLCLPIPIYLSLLGLKDDKTYRVFDNGLCFCQIMKSDTDGKITFFGYSDLSTDKLSRNPASISLNTSCPKCGAAMNFKVGRYGEFLGCSNYPTCNYTERIPILGHCSPTNEQLKELMRKNSLLIQKSQKQRAQKVSAKTCT